MGKTKIFMRHYIIILAVIVVKVLDPNKPVLPLPVVVNPLIRWLICWVSTTVFVHVFC